MCCIPVKKSDQETGKELELALRTRDPSLTSRTRLRTQKRFLKRPRPGKKETETETEESDAEPNQRRFKVQNRRNNFKDYSSFPSPSPSMPEPTPTKSAFEDPPPISTFRQRIPSHEQFEKDLAEIDQENKMNIEKQMKKMDWDATPTTPEASNDRVDIELSSPGDDLMSTRPRVKTTTELSSSAEDTTIYYEDVSQDIQKTIDDNMKAFQPNMGLNNLFKLDRPTTVASVTTEQTSDRQSGQRSNDGPTRKFVRERVFLPTQASTESTIETTSARSRVRPLTTKASTTTQVPIISPQRRAAIHQMNDRYRSQFMEGSKSYGKSSVSPGPTAFTTAETTTRGSYNAETTAETKKTSAGVGYKRRFGGASDFYEKFKKRKHGGYMSSRNKQTPEEPEEEEEEEQTPDPSPKPTSFSRTTPEESVKAPSLDLAEIRDIYDEEEDAQDEETDAVVPSVEPFSPSSNVGKPIRLWQTRPKKYMTSSDSPKAPTEMTSTSEITPTTATETSRYSRRPFGGSFDNTRFSNERSDDGAPADEGESDDDEEGGGSKDALKAFLASGKHGNDPRKIQEMIKRFYAQGNKPETTPEPRNEEADVAKSIFEKYSKKSSKPASSQTPDVKEEEEDYQEPEEDDEDDSKRDTTYPHDEEQEVSDAKDMELEKKEPEESHVAIRPWSPSLSGTYNSRGGSSSSYFQKFAKDNVGGSFRRPKPADEDADRAKEIFSKYKGTKNKNRYNSKTTTETPTSTDTPKPEPSQRVYTPRFTTPKADNDGFWPTPRPFRPRKTSYGSQAKEAKEEDKPKRISEWTPPSRRVPTRPERITTTTVSTTDTTSTSTTEAPTTTTTEVTSPVTIPTIKPKLDTSSFIFGDYDGAFVDLEKIPSNNFNSEISIDTSSFIYDDTETETTQGMTIPTQSSDQMDSPESSQDPSNTQLQARVPIRNVLDIFQELKYSFGKKT